MCGIVGIVPRSPADPERLQDVVRRMAAALTHRGPDDEGYFVTPDIALGVRRLSIIDVAGSRQPIHSSDRSKAIVFNGEVYNYRALREELTKLGLNFRTAGDTEVALGAVERWGLPGVERLEGMFAFAVWDQRAKQLTLVRDRLGQKSIYYAETDLGWLFASEIKGLLASRLLTAALDLETLSHYMSLRYLPGSGTLFAGICKLPAASIAQVDSRSRQHHRYWKPRYRPKIEHDEAEAIDTLDRLLSTVVREHLESEVPLGAFLSGGIDSSLVVAYASLASDKPLKTFTVGVHESSQSELPWARKVADHYGTEHFATIVRPDLATLAPLMVATLEEPVDPFAAGVYVVSEATARHVTVALGGDGGDELFAGYDRYLGHQLAEKYARLPAALRRHLLRPLLRSVPDSFGYKSLASKLRWLDVMADREGVARYAESMVFLRFPHSLKAELFSPQTWEKLEQRESERLLDDYFAAEGPEAFVDKMLHADCMTRLPEHLLPILDRMSMAHSLEARSPFLDRRVAEFAMRLPASWKMKKRTIKYVPRKLGERYLPRDLLARRKQGFGFPLALWLRGELRPLIARVVEESRLVDAGILSIGPMRRLLREHCEGRIDHNFRLWMLFNLELWYRHYLAGESVDELTAWVAEAKATPGPAVSH